MVRLEAVTKRYGPVTALAAADLSVAEGEFVTLLGPSGSGKTTLLNLVAGMISPTAGRIIIAGTDATQVPPERRGLGMVFQNYALRPHMTIFENVAFPLRVRRLPEGEIRRKVTEVLEMVQLPHVARRRPRELSGGQQQRVALPRALATRPSLLMLDEPLGALDLKLRRQLQDELRRIHRETGTTFLFVTHDQEEALYLSDRVAVMRHGRIEQLDAPGQIYRRPVNAFVADFVGDICFLDAEHDPAAGGVRLADGTHLPLALERGAGPVRLALRPEQVLVDGGAADGGLAATITEVTHDTGTTMLRLQLAGGAKLKSRRLGVDAGALRAGQAVRVRLGAEPMAFDPA